VLPGIWAGNLDGARYSEEDFAVISLCRLGEPFPHTLHRMAYIADNDHNADLDGMLADVLDDMAALRAEGHRLLVHCHGGASRTGLVLRAWLVREEGMPAEAATAYVAERWHTWACGTTASPPPSPGWSSRADLVGGTDEERPVDVAAIAAAVLRGKGNG
jgi:hypothetical protein